MLPRKVRAKSGGVLGSRLACDTSGAPARARPPAPTADAAVLQDMCKNRPLDLRGQRGFKVLILNEVDRLTKEAQHSLRRTMEKYSASCRLILCCSNVSKARCCGHARAALHGGTD